VGWDVVCVRSCDAIECQGNGRLRVQERLVSLEPILSEVLGPFPVLVGSILQQWTPCSVIKWRLIEVVV